MEKTLSDKNKKIIIMAQFIIPERNSTKEMRYQMGYALADLAKEYPSILAVDADLSTTAGCIFSNISILIN